MPRFEAVRAAIAVACLAAAVPAIAQSREPVQAHVSYAGIDLRTAAGQATLKQRLDRAASQACQSQMDGVAGFIDRNQCLAEMRRDTDQRLAALVQKNSAQFAAVNDSDTPPDHH